jgi:hypothetical protein
MPRNQRIEIGGGPFSKVNKVKRDPSQRFEENSPFVDRSIAGLANRNQPG